MNRDQYIAGLRRRRAATFRTPPLQCGCVDPWTCRCDDTGELSDIQVDAYRDTAVTLLGLGYTPAPNIPAMRVMWRRGGDERRLVQRISQLWQVAA